MTKKTEGLQQFRLISGCPKKFKDRNFETDCYITNKLNKIFEIYPDLPNNEIFREFKELPEKFFVDKK